jgi:DNA-binding PucR family transcriptional regulator
MTTAPDAVNLVRGTAAELLSEVDVHAAACARHIEHGMSVLGDDELSLGLLESVGENFRALLAAQRDGRRVDDLAAPRAALAYAEILVRRGIPLATLLRCYRFGISFLWELWRRELSERTEDPELLATTLDEAMQSVFEYVDRVCDQVTEGYTDARDRWSRSAAALRAETVRALLDGEPVDLDVAASRLGYALRRHHVAFVMSSEPRADGDDALRRLEQAAGWIAGALGCGRPLLVPQGLRALWMWVGLDEPPGEALTDLAMPSAELRGIDVGCGEASEDLEGFRRSHVEALEAARVAALGDRRSGRVVRYGKVVASSLLLNDPDRAAAFVVRELGPLGADDDGARRIRATVIAFMESGSRCATTARRLGVHQNTVAYRLAQAEKLLGHPLAVRRFEVEAALRLLPLVTRSAQRRPGGL